MKEIKNIEAVRHRGRIFYIIEAALEYFISLCVTSTFLTALLNEMQVSTAHQGIISSIASLACCIQLVAVFGVKKSYPCKRWVSILNLVNQLLFCLLYLIPLTSFRQELKIVLFVGMLFSAYFCQHYLTPSRTQWHMENVDDNKRGIFTANKEIVSLVGGMIFSQCAGIMLDHFKAKGDTRTCFVIFAVTIALLSLLHLISMIGIHEIKPTREIPKKTFGEILRTVFGNKQLRLVLLFDALFAISLVPGHFSTVYLTRTMGFSYTYITLIGIFHSAFRAIVSRFLGRYADKRSWTAMLKLCLLVSAGGYVVFAFCAPGSFGWLLYPIYSLAYAFSMGGTNSARINLCLDYVSHEDRRYILGVKNAFSGIVDFCVTLLVSLAVEAIESNGNMIFGFHIYPQQLLFFANALLLLSLTFFFLPKLKKKKSQTV